MNSIELHIERLVLDGLPLDSRQARQVQGAIEAHLTQLLSAGGSPSAPQMGSGAVPRLSGGTVTWNAAGGPGALGQQVGAAVFRSINT
jgi:hypothetical protein